MPNEREASPRQSVEHIANQRRSRITDELNEILTMLKDACPDNAIVSFDFDGRLHVHIDVHTLEDLLKVEGILPVLGAGIFHDLGRGDTPHHPFFHRLSAIVDR